MGHALKQWLKLRRIERLEEEGEWICGWNDVGSLGWDKCENGVDDEECSVDKQWDKRDLRGKNVGRSELRMGRSWFGKEKVGGGCNCK